MHSLHIKDIAKEDGGVFTCTVDNKMTQVQKTITLRVIKGERLLYIAREIMTLTTRFYYDMCIMIRGF